MYNTILLDLDGTVLDFSQSERYAFFCAMESYGIDVTEQDFARYREINAALWCALERGEVTKEQLRPLRFERLFAARGARDFAAMDAAYISFLGTKGVPFPGAVALVRALHARYRICVLTNGVRRSQEGRLQSSGLAPHIDWMLTSEEAGAEKPSPRIFRLAMERLHDTEPSHYVMLGDSLTADIAGAANAGIDTIWYAPPGSPTNPAIAATYVAHDYAEISRILR